MTWLLAWLAAAALANDGLDAVAEPEATDPRRSREDLEDALLTEAAYGNLRGAARDYAEIVRFRPLDDPSRAQALFALGRVHAELGDAYAAREALLEGIRTGSCLDPCQELLGRIELEQESITTLPVRWTFDDSNHGFFHPWQFDDRGTIRLERRAEDTFLVWRTTVDVHVGDQLVVGFKNPDPPPSRLRFRAQARATEAWLKVVIVDEVGRTYALPTGNFRIPVNRTTVVEVDLAEVHPIDPLDPVLDPARIALVQLRDVSGVEGESPGSTHTLYLDDFEVE